MPADLDEASPAFDPITPDQVDALKELADGPPVTPATAGRLRDRFGDRAAGRLLRTLELQSKARRKFGPGPWWVTSRGLQQATAWQVADYKATWFGDRPVVDLCCGVGGDLMRLARRGPVTGIDADAEISGMAAANLHAVTSGAYPGDGAFSAGVVCGDAVRFAGTSDAAVHIDPDRRATTSDDPSDATSPEIRTTSAERFSPAWEDVERILERSGDGVAKLAPATRIEGPVLERVHRCWIALGTTVREQAVLYGATLRRAGVNPATRSAVVIGADGRHERFAECGSESAEGSVPVARQMGTMLVDPHAAIRAAGLTEAFAVAKGLKLLAGPSGFLTTGADDASEEFGSLAFAERVEWEGRFDDRGLRRAFRGLNARPTTVKVRGVDAGPETLVKRYRKCGERATTLWLGRGGDGVFAAITTSR